MIKRFFQWYISVYKNAWKEILTFDKDYSKIGSWIPFKTILMIFVFHFTLLAISCVYILLIK